LPYIEINNEHSYCTSIQTPTKFFLEGSSPFTDFIFTDTVGIVEWKCPRLNTGIEYSGNHLQFSVRVEDCLSRKSVIAVSIKCMTKHSTFSNLADVEKNFISFKTTPTKLQTASKSNSINPALTITPGLYNFIWSVSQCNIDTTIKLFDTPSLSKLTPKFSPDVFSYTLSSGSFTLTKKPAFTFTSPITVVSVWYEFSDDSMGLGAVTLNSDVFTITVDLIDFTSNVPTFIDLPTAITVNEGDTFTFNPCKSIF
jgi:hypothetical protein